MRIVKSLEQAEPGMYSWTENPKEGFFIVITNLENREKNTVIFVDRAGNPSTSTHYKNYTNQYPINVTLKIN